ncbi:MAG: DUF4386 domain-containing protein [Actinobacteria bacterium]|nr:DUF4386 domain-containing protein [Actinomycetota bacterium]
MKPLNDAKENKMDSLKKTARLAGLLYLIWILTAIYGLMFVQPRTIVQGDAVATANKILANEFIFRTGIINGIISTIIWILIGLTLYRLFRHVNERQAKLLVVLVIVQIPASFIIEALNLTSLKLFKGEILKTFDLSQRQDLAMLFLKMNDYIIIALEMFWGLWLFPFGLLVYKSGFIPRILGIFLILNGIAYIIHCFTHLLLPNYQALVFKIATPIWTLGEISIMLWLLIKGVKNNIPTIDKQ